MAGLSGLRAATYYGYFLLGSAPFAFILAYAGSISSFREPWPALVAGAGVPGILFVAGWLLRRRS
jgi:hypothetical protein